MPGQPYVTKLSDGRYFAVELPAGSAQLDPLTAELILQPPAVHLLDRLRVLLSPLPSSATPARLRILRRGLRMSRDQLAEKLRVEVRDVADWEAARSRPGADRLARLDHLRKHAVRTGLLLAEGDGRRPANRHRSKRRSK